MTTANLPENLAVLVIAPEAASDKIILDIGKRLADNGFFFRSGSIINGTHEMVDLMYKSGPTHKENRVITISNTFASYSEYANQSCAFILLEHLGFGCTSAIESLNKIKGRSRHPEKGTLRGISKMTRHMYSYVHVPDPDIVDDVFKWSLAPLEMINPLDVNTNQIFWVLVQKVLTFHHTNHVSNSQNLLLQIVQHCLRTFLLSNINVVLDQLNKEDISILLNVVSTTKMDSQLIEAYLRKFRNSIISECYACRRLNLIVETAILLLDSTRKNIINAIELAELFDYAGILLHPSRFQLLLSTFLSKS